MSNLIRKEYRIKEDVVRAQYSPDIQEYISNQLFETRINEFNAAINRRALGKGPYIILYLFTTILALAIGIPTTATKVNEDNYSGYWWWIFFSILMLVYCIVAFIHLAMSIENQKTKMKEVEKVMAQINITDNPSHIFWKLDFTDKYIMEGYRKKDYFVILELSSPTITHQVTVLPPPSITTAPLQQQIVILTGNATTLPLSNSAQTTQTISIDASQLNQILAVAQQQQIPPPPPPKY